MNNVYGIEAESAGRAPLEAIETECPYCHGRHVEYLRFGANENGMQETYKCFDCDVEFSCELEIPYAKARRMNEQLYLVPVSYSSEKVIVRVISTNARGLRGEQMFEVEAIQGEPFVRYGFHGWSSSRTAKYFPEHVEPINETAPRAIEAVSSQKYCEQPEL